MTKISALTQDTTPDGGDEVVVQRSAASNFRVSLTNAIRTLVGLEKQAGTANFCLNPADNALDTTTSLQTLVGAGSSSSPNYIGREDGLPTGTDLNPGWSADSGWSAGATQASSIVGGYDQIVNAIGSVIVNSNHSMISYNVSGHSTIIGNSYNWIGPSAARGSILGSNESSIQSGTGNVIFGGKNNDITGSGSDYGCIMSGQDCTLSTTGDHAGILGGDGHTISGAATWSYIFGGETNTISGGNRTSIFGGADNVISGGNYASIIGGQGNEVSHQSAVALGEESKSMCRAGIVQSSGEIAAAGDCQNVQCHYKATTTNATATSMTTGASGEYLQLDASKTTIISGIFTLVGIDTATGDSCSFELQCSIHYDGTTARVYDSGGNAVNTRNMTQIHDAITVGTQVIVASGGTIRPRVTGASATNMQWSASFNGTMTYI